MGKVIIQNETIIDPISLIGREAGVCWGADITNAEKNYKRGIECLASRHGRTWEYAQVFIVLDGYSARVIREFYTHIGGAPTRLQASTRYINYQNGFKYVVPPKVENNIEANTIYNNAMNELLNAMRELESLGVPKEDVNMLLPLGMGNENCISYKSQKFNWYGTSEIMYKSILEYRELINDIMHELQKYSDEWKYLVSHYFKPKCEELGYCNENIHLEAVTD